MVELAFLPMMPTAIDVVIWVEHGSDRQRGHDDDDDDEDKEEDKDSAGRPRKLINFYQACLWTTCARYRFTPHVPRLQRQRIL